MSLHMLRISCWQSSQVAAEAGSKPDTLRLQGSKHSCDGILNHSMLTRCNTDGFVSIGSDSQLWARQPSLNAYTREGEQTFPTHSKLLFVFASHGPEHLHVWTRTWNSQPALPPAPPYNGLDMQSQKPRTFKAVKGPNIIYPKAFEGSRFGVFTRKGCQKRPSNRPFFRDPPFEAFLGHKPS